MKILMVCRSILPYPGGSSVVIENLAKHFQQDELIVLGNEPYFGKKKLERPAHYPSFIYFPSELTFFGRGYRYFKWTLKWHFKPLVNKISAIIKEHHINYVIGIYPTDFFCLAACRAAQQTNTKFSTYFHNTYLENTNITDPNAPTIQEELFDQSEYVFVMSSAMEEFYKEKYKLDKFKPLVHTFDEYPKAEILTGLPGTDKSSYKLFSIGNFNESNMEATRRFVSTIKSNPKYQLHVHTHVPKLLLQKRGLDIDGIQYMGFAPIGKLQESLQRYDIGVLTHGFSGNYGDIEYKTIFPTRTIPLLLSKKPLIVHSPKGSFLNKFITKHQCAMLVDEAAPEAIIEGLESIANDEAYQQTLVDNATEAVKQFYGPTVVKQLKSKLMAQ